MYTPTKNFHFVDGEDRRWVTCAFTSKLMQFRSKFPATDGVAIFPTFVQRQLTGNSEEMPIFSGPTLLLEAEYDRAQSRGVSHLMDYLKLLRLAEAREITKTAQSVAALAN